MEATELLVVLALVVQSIADITSHGRQLHSRADNDLQGVFCHVLIVNRCGWTATKIVLN